MLKGEGRGRANSGSGEDASRWALVLLCAGVFTATLFAYTRNNDFPFYYHPSEPTKAGQLIEHEYNYLHPLLMLTATQVSRKVLDVPDERQPIVEVGRWVSAVFASMAVVALLWIGWRVLGLAGALCVGSFVALTPRLGELAHFMKEDPTLAMGLTAFLAGFFFYWERRSSGRLVVLAVATALACSGKYVGAVVLVVALPAVILARGEGRLASRGHRAVLYLGVLFALLAGLNYQVFRALPNLVLGVSHEISHVTTGHYGFTHDVPHAKAFRVMLGSGALVPLLAGVHVLWMVATARRRSFAEWLVAGFPFGFALLLSFSSIMAGRYVLPAELTLNLLAGLGLARLIVWGTPSAPLWRAPLAACAAAGVLVLLWPGFEAKAIESFRHDTHTQLRVWVEENLPANAVIIQHRDVHLPTRRYWKHRGRSDFLEQEVVLISPRGEFWSYSEMLERGVTHVALRLRGYQRYVDGRQHVLVEGFEEEYEHRRRFYQRVVGEGVQLWQSPEELLDGRLTPKLRLFQVAEPGPS